MGADDFFQSNYAPPTAFYFEVKFDGFTDMDSSFQDVSGLEVKISVEEKKEGGENQFVHYLPKPPTYTDLVLKRCLLMNSDLDKWCRDALEDFIFKPKNIKLSLLGPDGTALSSWTILHAYPIAWQLGTLNSTSNDLAIETLTLKYRSFRKN